MNPHPLPYAVRVFTYTVSQSKRGTKGDGVQQSFSTAGPRKVLLEFVILFF